MIIMGGCCHRCRHNKLSDLEFHHTRSRTWVARAVNSRKRMRLYIADWLAGVLVLACGECNKLIGRPDEGDGPDADF